jgi:hemoglobin
MDQNLFDRFGGHAAVARLVFAFYDRVLRSERLAPYFRDVDMRRLVEHQAKFVSQLMGGPVSYSDSELRQVHAHLEVDDVTFDEMMLQFQRALGDFGLAEADMDLVMAGMRARRPAIVTAGRTVSARPAEPVPTGR